MLEFVWQETGAPPHKVGKNGFGHLVLTEIVPKTLRGRGIFTDNADGIIYRLSMHPQYYRTIGALDPELALSRHPAVTVLSLLSAANQT